MFIYAFRTTHDVYNTLNQRPTSNIKAHAAAVGTYFSTAERLHKDRFTVKRIRYRCTVRFIIRFLKKKLHMEKVP